MGLKDFIVPTRISSDDDTKLTKQIIWKNYILICISMCFFYTAVNGIGGIQSTVNKEGGLGLASSSVVYSVFGLSALMIPQLLMNLIKFKWTLTLGFALQLFYIGLNAYPKWYTYLPASGLGGFGQSLAFTCAATGIRELCQIYGRVTSSDASSIQGLFFGIFGIFIQSAGVIGYSFIALIFRQENKETMGNSTDMLDFNFTNLFNYSVCGKDFCPKTELPPTATPEPFRVYLLVTVFGVCAVISIILSLFLNDIDYVKKGDNATFGQLVSHQLQELKRQFFCVDQLLAMPINLMNAFVLTFLWVDFTRSFAACSAGLDYIGWSTMVLYGTAAVFSPVFGKLAEKLTIVPVFLFYWGLTLGTSVYMLFWQSSPDSTHKLFTLAILLGVIEAINTPLPRALYGMLFKTEVIYSSFTFFQGVGMLFGFLMTTFFCTYIKIYILIGYSGLCFTCGLILYYKKRRKSRYEEQQQAEQMQTFLPKNA